MTAAPGSPPEPTCPARVLVTAGLMLGVTTIVQAPDRGWTSP